MSLLFFDGMTQSESKLAKLRQLRWEIGQDIIEGLQHMFGVSRTERYWAHVARSAAEAQARKLKERRELWGQITRR